MAKTFYFWQAISKKAKWRPWFVCVNASESEKAIERLTFHTNDLQEDQTK